MVRLTLCYFWLGFFNKFVGFDNWMAWRGLMKTGGKDSGDGCWLSYRSVELWLFFCQFHVLKKMLMIFCLSDIISTCAQVCLLLHMDYFIFFYLLKILINPVGYFWYQGKNLRVLKLLLFLDFYVVVDCSNWKLRRSEVRKTTSCFLLSWVLFILHLHSYI